jgi:hypothetical protein
MRVKFTGFVEIPEKHRGNRQSASDAILFMIKDALFNLKWYDAVVRLSLTWEETKVPDKGIE